MPGTVVRQRTRVLALDTGFLVHNTRNYPLLTRLLAELGVRTQESEMSFSVTCARCGLADAQLATHRMICRKLRLTADDHLLEIGCGWGAFAMVAAGEFGARVTGVTLAEEHPALASERIRDADLADRIELRLQDDRILEGAYTAIASTEMIDAIGRRELPRLFASVDRLLAPNGVACIQAIAMPDERYHRYRRSRDWISEYIFPGGNLPSLEAMARAMAARSHLVVAGVEDIGIHCARARALARPI